MCFVPASGINPMQTDAPPFPNVSGKIVIITIKNIKELRACRAVQSHTGDATLPSETFSTK